MIKKTILLLTVVCTLTILVSAQRKATVSDYQELPDPKPGNKAEWQKMQEDTYISFANADERFAKSKPVNIYPVQNTWTPVAWRGEKVHTQILVWTKKKLEKVEVRAGALASEKGGKIPASQMSVGFLRYVLTDGLNKDGGGCGIPPASESDSSLSADAIDIKRSGSIEAYTAQPFWVSIKVPQSTPSGLYKGSLQIYIDGSKHELPCELTVKDWILPEPSQWQYHLDIWQNPFSVARFHNVKAWSKEHFNLMKPYMKMLADAGQKTITVSMIHDPWRGQTYDIYNSMIKWIRHKDGSWSYDYTIFDKWVSFMMSLGVNKLVNCYTMVPWNNKFYYYDEALGKDTLLIAKTGTPEYIAHWTPMLKDFAQHLKKKGWFDKTAIAMDERPMEDMQKVIDLVKQIDPDYKISLAGSYHAAIERNIYDYCIASAESYPVDVIKRRNEEGRPTTFYTYCMEGHPNTFTFSPPAESAWMGWHAANKGYNGYLRWAYNCWPRNPLQDSRFSTWSAGDTYFVYPGPMSSVRFERLLEGAQDYEKIRILQEYFKKNNQQDKLEKLQAILKPFETEALKKQSAAEMLNKAKAALNEL